MFNAVAQVQCSFGNAP